MFSGPKFEGCIEKRAVLFGLGRAPMPVLAAMMMSEVVLAASDHRPRLGVEMSGCR